MKLFVIMYTHIWTVAITRLHGTVTIIKLENLITITAELLIDYNRLQLKSAYQWMLLNVSLLLFIQLCICCSISCLRGTLVVPEARSEYQIRRTLMWVNYVFTFGEFVSISANTLVSSHRCSNQNVRLIFAIQKIKIAYHQKNMKCLTLEGQRHALSPNNALKICNVPLFALVSYRNIPVFLEIKHFSSFI